VNLEMRRRGMLIKRGDTLFRHFDGATMVSLQFPSRVIEEVHCRSRPETELCALDHGFESDQPSKLASLLGVGGKRSHAGLFVSADMPAGPNVAIEESVDSVLFPPSTTSLIEDMSRVGVSDFWKSFVYLMLQCGTKTTFYGDIAYLVEIGINNAVNDTNVPRFPVLIGDTKVNVSELFKSNQTRAYSPVIDRHFMWHVKGLHVGTNHDKVGGKSYFGAFWREAAKCEAAE